MRLLLKGNAQYSAAEAFTEETRHDVQAQSQQEYIARSCVV